MSRQQGHQRQVMPYAQAMDDMRQRQWRLLLGPPGVWASWPQKSDQQAAQQHT